MIWQFSLWSLQLKSEFSSSRCAFLYIYSVFHKSHKLENVFFFSQFEYVVKIPECRLESNNMQTNEPFWTFIICVFLSENERQYTSGPERPNTREGLHNVSFSAKWSAHLPTHKTDSNKQVLVALLCVGERERSVWVRHVAQSEPRPETGVWDCWDSWLLPPGPT